MSEGSPLFVSPAGGVFCGNDGVALDGDGTGAVRVPSQAVPAQEEEHANAKRKRSVDDDDDDDDENAPNDDGTRRELFPVASAASAASADQPKRKRLCLSLSTATRSRLTPWNRLPFPPLIVSFVSQRGVDIACMMDVVRWESVQEQTLRMCGELNLSYNSACACICSLPLTRGPLVGMASPIKAQFMLALINRSPGQYVEVHLLEISTDKFQVETK